MSEIVIEYDYVMSRTNDKKRKKLYPHSTSSLLEVDEESDDVSIAMTYPRPDFKPTFLSCVNPHTLDTTIKFDEGTHTYAVKWSPQSDHTCHMIISVSSFIHMFFKHFDPDTVIKRIRISRSPATQKKYKGMSDDEIKKAWKLNGEVASKKGTFLHYLCELSMNGFDLRSSMYQNLVPIRQFLKWKTNIFEKNYYPYRTEFRLRTDTSTKVTGTADLIAVNKIQTSQDTNTLEMTIIDFKFSKNIRKENRYEFGEGPCSNMPNVNYSHYTLQQNIYAWIFEKYYSPILWRGRVYKNIKVVDMFLAVFHENYAPDGNFMRLPRRHDIVNGMVDVRKKSINS